MFCRLMAKRAFSLVLFLTVVFLAGSCRQADAHPLNNGYSMIAVNDRALDYDLYIPESSFLLFDANVDGMLTAAELEKQKTDIVSYLTEHLLVQNGREELPLALDSIELGDKNGISQVILHLRFASAEPIGDVHVEYNLLFDDGDPEHVSYVYLTDGNTVDQSLFDIGIRTYDYNPAGRSLDAVGKFLLLGIKHIWQGTDHLLFLLLLLVASRKLSDIVKIVTAFTAAHTITLMLTATGTIAAPPWVEPAIALSICYVAVDNLWIRSTRSRWAITFGFGLVHGMGFAGALLAEGVPARFTIGSLISFNVGVELGQLALVLIALPLLLRLQKWRHYPKVTTVISAAVFLIALYWFGQRIGVV